MIAALLLTATIGVDPHGGTRANLHSGNFRGFGDRLHEIELYRLYENAYGQKRQQNDGLEKRLESLERRLETLTAALLGQTGVVKPAPLAKVAKPAVRTVISEKCSRCHGAQNASPPGGLYFADGATYDSNILARAMRAVISGTMPPEGEALTKDEIVGVANEMLGSFGGDQ